MTKINEKGTGLDFSAHRLPHTLPPSCSKVCSGKGFFTYKERTFGPCLCEICTNPTLTFDLRHESIPRQCRNSGVVYYLEEKVDRCNCCDGLGITMPIEPSPEPFIPPPEPPPIEPLPEQQVLPEPPLPLFDLPKKY